MRTIKTRHFTGTTDNTVTKRELDNRKVARKAAAEGMVLLKNEGILPLKEGTKIALYGVGASRTIKAQILYDTKVKMRGEKTMQNKKTVKEAVFLVLALIVMIGSRFMPAAAMALTSSGQASTQLPVKKNVA